MRPKYLDQKLKGTEAVEKINDALIAIACAYFQGRSNRIRFLVSVCAIINRCQREHTLKFYEDLAELYAEELSKEIATGI